MRVEPSVCPRCGAVQDGATEVTGDEAKRPQPGDASICWACGSLSTFTEGGGRREPTGAELARFLGDRRIATALSLWRRRPRRP